MTTKEKILKEFRDMFLNFDHFQPCHKKVHDGTCDVSRDLFEVQEIIESFLSKAIDETYENGYLQCSEDIRSGIKRVVKERGKGMK